MVPKMLVFFEDEQTHGARYCGHEYVPLRFGGNVIMRMGTQPQQQILIGNGRTLGAPYCGHGYVPLRFWGNVVMRMGTEQQLLTGTNVNISNELNFSDVY